MQVKRLEAADAQRAFEAIGTIKRPDSHSTLGVDALRRFLSRSDHVLIVASEEGAPAGFLLAYLLDRLDGDRPMACLYEIEVAATHRRLGIGRAMVDLLKTVCRQAGVVKTWAVTNRSNEAAVRFYESTGAEADPNGDDLLFVYRS